VLDTKASGAATEFLDGLPLEERRRGPLKWPHGNWVGIVCQDRSRQFALLFLCLVTGLPGGGVTVVGSKSGGNGQYKLAKEKKERQESR
jgi:hypothetical protein